MDATEGAHSGATYAGAAYGQERVAYWIHVAEDSEIYALSNNGLYRTRRDRMKPR
jgi:hypothetical protein